MKKFLTVVLAVVMIASMASLAAFAEDPAKINGAAVEVEVGATTAAVPVTITNIPARGIASAKVLFAFDEALTVESGAAGEGPGQNMPGPTKPEDGYKAGNFAFVWVGGTADMKADFTLCTINFNLPENAKVGDSWEITLSYSEDDTFDIDCENVACEVTNATITVVEAAQTTEAQGDDTTVAGDDTTVAGDDTTAAEPTDDTTVAGDDTTAAEPTDDTTTAKEEPKAPQTGDMLVVVIAAMIVALGAAVVVKKVNAR